MPILNKQKKSLYQREDSPGFLEKLGVKYYRYLAEKTGTADMQNISIDDLPPDITLQTLSSSITAFAAVIAFAIGALTTFISIWIEWTFKSTLDTVPYYFLYGSVLITMLIAEMSVLFWLGLKTVYSLACLTGHNQSAKGSDHLISGKLL